MHPLLHLELARIRVADDRRLACSWHRPRRARVTDAALAPVTPLAPPVAVPDRACA